MADFKYYLVIFFGLFGAGCGEWSSVIDGQFLKPSKAIPQVPSSPYLGLNSASGKKQMGAFRVDASIGEAHSKIYQSKDGFTFYGGIQGQEISR